jgi:adenylyltransferase/sulfurtransferase
MQTFDELGSATGAAAGESRPLADASVLVIGVGALGSPVSLQLAAAGVGRLVLLDPDVVEPSNLHRQIVHRTSDVGRPKVDSARDFLRRFAGVKVDARREAFCAENWQRATAGVDFVVDATDGAEVKFLINDAAIAASLPFSHAGVVGLRGQTMTVLPGRSACLRCLFLDPPSPGSVPTCQEAGILGTVAGTIGFLQASEAIRVLSGRSPLLADRLLTYEARAGRWRHVPLTRSASCPACATAVERRPARWAGTPRNGVDA